MFPHLLMLVVWSRGQRTGFASRAGWRLRRLNGRLLMAAIREPYATLIHALKYDGILPVAERLGGLLAEAILQS